ncbi:hypothetical protein CRG98_017759 [Punica granatum]|uniref:Uncharacterized protein n=1 Tax=Punica granatum TaxID=22663 RepID=A0A2I0JZV8_PUNGR|nr:hypothetical protein CRG98_017759 [Punica granatum]
MRDRGCQLAIPTPPSRSPVSSVGTNKLDGGVGIADCGPDPASESLVDSELGPLIGCSNPSTEVSGVLCGYRRPQWSGRDRRLAAPTFFSLSIFFI